MIGEIFGNYRIVRLLGQGGMGTVYLAEHVRIARRAAIKVLLPQYSDDAAAQIFSDNGGVLPCDRQAHILCAEQ